MSSSYGHDFTENLEAVARGVRLLEEVRDPELRDAIRAAIGMPPETPVLDGPRRARMRRGVLVAEPRGPRLSDRLVAVFTVLAFPAPYAVRALAICALVVGALAGTAVASADAMPDDARYPVKLTAEHLRLTLAVAPADRAAVELSLAEHRLSEAEQLAAEGRESDALVATSAYAAHLASAAAELSEVDALAPRAIALLTQLEARLIEQRTRAAQTAERLMSDPRTALAGVVLSAIATAPEGRGPTTASRIADSASAVSSRLAGVADDRARGGQPLHDALTEILGRVPVSGPMYEEPSEVSEDAATEETDGAAEAEGAEPGTTPMFVVPPTRPTPAPPASATPTTTAPTRTPVATESSAATATPTEPPAVRASSPRATTPRSTARPSASPRVAAKPAAKAVATPWATIDPSARIAAEKAKQSAAKARAALDKAIQAAKRTPSPKPSAKPTTPTRTAAR